MKAGVAIFLDVFKKIYSSNYRFNLILLLTSNEEGMSKGSYRAVNTIKEKKYKPLISLITEPTQECIMLGARGRYTIEISVCGISAHGAVPELGVNAISDAAEIVRSLENLKLKYDRVLGYGSTCVLKIDGGTTTLSVPELCKIYVDRHFVRNESEKYILADFKKIINKLKLKSDVKVRIMPRETPYLKPYLTQSNDRYVKLFCTEYKNFYQTKPKFMYARSVGDFNRFGEIMPTIVFGPIGMNWHAADEYVNISSVIRCRDFYLNYLKHLDAKIRKGFL
jgi:acetylornithine deacetylase/succinyl-diaminopimelate desuccinylase-like protein